jgi:hypothetical protein
LRLRAVCSHLTPFILTLECRKLVRRKFLGRYKFAKHNVY